MRTKPSVYVASLPTKLDLRNDIVNALISLLLKIEDGGRVLDKNTGEPNEVQIHVNLQIS